MSLCVKWRYFWEFLQGRLEEWRTSIANVVGTARQCIGKYTSFTVLHWNDMTPGGWSSTETKFISRLEILSGPNTKHCRTSHPLISEAGLARVRLPFTLCSWEALSQGLTERSAVGAAGVHVCVWGYQGGNSWTHNTRLHSWPQEGIAYEGKRKLNHTKRGKSRCFEVIQF